MPPWATKRDQQASKRVDAAWWDYLAGQERSAYREDAERTAAKRRANPHNRADKSARQPGAAKGAGGKRAPATGVLPGATATRDQPARSSGGSAPDKPGIAELSGWAPARNGMSDAEYAEKLKQIEHERTAYRKHPGYQPGATPGGPTSGGSMSSGVSYGELKARIMGISDHTKDLQGPLSAALQEIDGQIAEAMAANEESNALDGTVSALQQAREHVEQAMQNAGLASDQASEAAAQLK